MSSLKCLRTNPHNLNLLLGHWDVYMATQHKTWRHAHLRQARQPDVPTAVRKLYVAFARDDHHEYLGYMRSLKQAQESTV